MEELFTSTQLRLIDVIADECTDRDEDGQHIYRPGEAMALYNTIAAMRVSLGSDSDWTAERLGVLKFCCTEIEHQEDGAMDAYNYVVAWNKAIAWKRAGVKLTAQLIHELATIHTPAKTAGGYRTGTVTRKGGILIGSDPRDIERDMHDFELRVEMYLEDGTDGWRPVTSDSLYERYEGIHPEVDGNGRNGKIIFNWVEDTLTEPTFPAEPESFKSVFD